MHDPLLYSIALAQRYNDLARRSRQGGALPRRIPFPKKRRGATGKHPEKMRKKMKHVAFDKS